MPGSNEKNEAVRQALSALSGKWKIEILELLREKPRRFNELRNSLPRITQHVLSSQLRALEADGLISRRLYSEAPPRVEYRITPAATQLQPILEAVAGWIKDWPPRL